LNAGSSGSFGPERIGSMGLAEEVYATRKAK
jgi:hypothetical protein